VSRPAIIPLTAKISVECDDVLYANAATMLNQQRQTGFAALSAACPPEQCTITAIR